MGLLLLVLLLGCSSSARPLGVVSSVWTALLPNHTVAELVQKLAGLGVSYIELRQGTLPGYEDPATHAPDAAALAALVAQFPELAFSYAFQLPFLSSPGAADTWNSTLFASALHTTVAMASEPLLRLVDVATNNKNFNASLAEASKSALGTMARLALQSHTLLAVENAAVKWASFRDVVQDTAWLVFDACNLAWVSDGLQGPQVGLVWSAFSPSTEQVALAAARHLTPHNTLLLHVKQVPVGGGAVLPVVAPGAMDWVALAAIFNERLAATPLLLEVTSSPALWSNLQQSVSYLSQCGFVFD